MASGLQCFGCGVQFGIFKREYSCKNCGHIFCSSCTSQTTQVPKEGPGKHKVCFQCFKLLTNPPDFPARVTNTRNQQTQNDLNKINEPTATSSKCLSPDQLDVNNLPTNSKGEGNKTTDPDEKIRQRLQQLKDNSKDSAKVTDEDIGKRFEDLAGRKAISMQKTNVNSIQPKKTEGEQLSDLLKQVRDECKLEGNTGASSTDVEIKEVDEADEKDEIQALINKTMQQCQTEKSTETEIEERLARLKGLDPSIYRNAVPQGCSLDSDDEETYNRRYLQQVLSEALLDEKTEAMGYDLKGKKNTENSCKDKPTKQGKPTDSVDTRPAVKPGNMFSKESEPDSDEEELPWCCICNADALWRCQGCDDDLYCKRCYREGHKYEDPEEHSVTPFRPRKKHP